MSIDLKKKSEAIGRILLTKGITTAPIMRVGIAIDISGSMQGMLRESAGRSSVVQTAFDQMMGVAVKFDDNGELDVFKFDTRCEYVGTSSPTNYANYISDNGITARGGTAYSVIAESANEFFFKPKSTGFFGFGKKSAEPANDMPVLMIILTDGEPASETYSQVLRAFQESQGKNIYFHLVGVGGSRNDFPTIARLADALPNVGEVYLPRLDMSDEAIYEQLICDELVEWVGKFTPSSAARA